MRSYNDSSKDGASQKLVWTDDYFRQVKFQDRTLLEHSDLPVHDSVVPSDDPASEVALSRSIQLSLEKLLIENQDQISDRTICKDLAAIYRLIDSPDSGKKSKSERVDAILLIGQTNPFEKVRVTVLHSLTSPELLEETAASLQALDFIEDSFSYNNPKVQNAALRALAALSEIGYQPNQTLSLTLRTIYKDEQNSFGKNCREELGLIVNRLDTFAKH